MTDDSREAVVQAMWRAYALAHFKLKDSVPTEREYAGIDAALEVALNEGPMAAAWEGGYGKGYSEGYTWAVNEVIGWLRGEGHGEAAEALAYLISPEGVAAMNQRLRELYGSLNKLAREAREARGT